MLKPNQSHFCRTPDLCTIACPYNRILTELAEVLGEPLEPLPGDEDQPIEVVFNDSEKTGESS